MDFSTTWPAESRTVKFTVGMNAIGAIESSRVMRPTRESDGVLKWKCAYEDIPKNPGHQFTISCEVKMTEEQLDALTLSAQRVHVLSPHVPQRDDRIPAPLPPQSSS